VIYSAYAIPLESGTTGLYLFIEGFDNEDDAERFLSHLMMPFEEGHWPESDTLHSNAKKNDRDRLHAASAAA